MRIEAYTQVQQIYNASKIDKSRRNVKANASETDRLEISGTGRDYQISKVEEAAAADVRDDVTAPLKKSIQAGTYEVSVGKFADKLLQRMEEMR